MTMIAKRVVRNASWIVFARIAQMVISLIVGMITARYLGPGNYGLINYAAAYVAFFTSFSTLGINSILVREYVYDRSKEGEITGTSLLLRFISSFISLLCIISISCVFDHDDPTCIIVVTLYSLSLLFSYFDTFDYWFQSRYESKYPALIKTGAFFIIAIYKIILLILETNIFWFAASNAIDLALIAVCYLFLYRKKGGQRLSVSLQRTSNILKQSYHFILSGLMVAIYGYSDKMMLKHYLSSSDVGYYSCSVAICAMWTFILSAIIDSMRPDIIESRKDSIFVYERKLVFLYSLIVYISIFVSIIFTIFGYHIIWLLYGEHFLPAVQCLQIVTWYTAFSYLGVARDIWLICENYQKYVKYIYFFAAFLNVGLNMLMIPIWGTVGAAVASLFTQICTSIIIPHLVFKPMRRNTYFIIRAAHPKQLVIISKQLLAIFKSN